ncbi:CgeB family protein [Nitratidesulfovibrio sp. D1]
MQIHTFYPQYLAAVYGQYPQLAQTDFASQTRLLEQDGFSAVHLLGFHMEPLGYRSQVVIGNNLPSQYAWAFEHGLARGPRRAPSLEEILIAQVEAFQPDVLYLSDPITYDSRFVRRLSLRPRLVLGWRAANVPDNWDASEFDVMLSCLSGMRSRALEQGARDAVHFYPGFPQQFSDAVRQVPASYDVCFYGQVNGNQYPARISMLHKLAELCVQDGLALRMHLSGQVETATPLTRAVNIGPIYGMNMYAALRSSRMVFDVRGSIGTKDRQGSVRDLAGRETANMRIFEATGVGTCLLTEQYDNLDELFEPDREIITYSSEKEMMDKLRYYLSHEEERQEIASAGLARCQRDHSMASRIREFDTLIRRKLPHASTQAEAVPLSIRPAPFEAGTVPPPRDIERIVASLGRLSASGRMQDSVATPLLHQAMDLAEALLLAGNPQHAAHLLAAAKALGVVTPGLDILRAKAFLTLSRKDEARAALEEELRRSPHNEYAQKLLARLGNSASRQ